MSDNLNKHLFDFREHLKIKNSSPATIKLYGQNLQKFLDYLKEINTTDIKRVTKDILKDYQLKIADGKDYSTSTQSVKIRAVKRFFEYLEETNHILINPAEYIKEPKKETRLPRVVLTKKEAGKILDQPNLSTVLGIRDRTILEIFYTTGIRLEEMTNLTIYDCDLQGGLLRVNKGKFAKDRVIPLGKHAVKFIKEYITHIRPRHTRKNKSIRTPSTVLRTCLFVNRSGKALSKEMIEVLVRSYARAAKVKKKVTPHTFRHTFATELVKNGADIRAVQKMLGHSKLKVTQIYTKVAGVEVKKTHRTSHPREKDKATKKEIKADIKHIKRKFKRD